MGATCPTTASTAVMAITEWSIAPGEVLESHRVDASLSHHRISGINPGRRPSTPAGQYDYAGVFRAFPSIPTTSPTVVSAAWRPVATIAASSSRIRGVARSQADRQARWCAMAQVAHPLRTKREGTRRVTPIHWCDPSTRLCSTEHSVYKGWRRTAGPPDLRTRLAKRQVRAHIVAARSLEPARTEKFLRRKHL
jgi:hypothetical protein